MFMIGTESEPERVLAGASPDFGEDVLESCAAGSLNPVESIGQDELAIALEYDHGRETVPALHRLRVFHHRGVVNVGTGLRSGIEAD